MRAKGRLIEEFIDADLGICVQLRFHKDTYLFTAELPNGKGLRSTKAEEVKTQIEEYIDLLRTANITYSRYIKARYYRRYRSEVYCGMDIEFEDKLLVTDGVSDKVYDMPYSDNPGFQSKYWDRELSIGDVGLTFTVAARYTRKDKICYIPYSEELWNNLVALRDSISSLEASILSYINEDNAAQLIHNLTLFLEDA